MAAIGLSMLILFAVIFLRHSRKRRSNSPSTQRKDLADGSWQRTVVSPVLGMLGEESTSAVSAAPHVVSTIPPLGFYNTSTQLGSQIYSNENAYLVPRPLNLTNETSAVRTHLQSDLQRGSMISPLYAAVDYSKVDQYDNRDSAQYEVAVSAVPRASRIWDAQYQQSHAHDTQIKHHYEYTEAATS